MVLFVTTSVEKQPKNPSSVQTSQAVPLLTLETIAKQWITSLYFTHNDTPARDRLFPQQSEAVESQESLDAAGRVDQWASTLWSVDFLWWAEGVVLLIVDTTWTLRITSWVRLCLWSNCAGQGASGEVQLRLQSAAFQTASACFSAALMEGFVGCIATAGNGGDADQYERNARTPTRKCDVAVLHPSITSTKNIPAHILSGIVPCWSSQINSH